MFRNKKTSNEIPTLVNGDVELSSAEDKACAFAKKLANTFSETPISESDKFFDNIYKKKVEETIESNEWCKNLDNNPKLI